MNSKLIGGILLVVGTSIGGGMLALPIATAQGGFLGALILLFSAWIVMTAGALLILEVNLSFPQDSNIISMVRHTLGPAAEIIAWISYLMLLYCLLSAYIAGGTDLFSLLLNKAHLLIPHWLTAVIFVFLFGAIVANGIKSVDIINRIIMIIKFASLFILLLIIIPHVHVKYLTKLNSAYLVSAITVVITSFGFATIVPSLRSYFDSDVKILRKIIIIGSLIPLICYIAWVGAIIGEIPWHGSFGLLAIINSKHTTAMLTQSLIIVLNNPWITYLASTFTSICILTSFLGVSLCLSDFLADGLKRPKQGWNQLLIYGLTFIPPFSIVMIKPNLFIMGLSYAGIFCVILLVLFPALMAWRSRYHLNMQSSYQLFGGKTLLVLLTLVSFLILIHEFLLSFNFL